MRRWVLASGPFRGRVDVFVNGAIVVVGSILVPAIPPDIPEATYAYLLATDSTGQAVAHENHDLGGDCEAHSVLFQPDGKIVMAGVAEDNTAIAVARLGIGLDLDTSFSGDGIYTYDFGEGDDEGWDLALQPDGKILVAGSATIDGLLQAVVFRLTDSGTKDKFGPVLGGSSQGYTAFTFGTESRALSVAYARYAKLVVAGDAVAGNGRSVFLAAQLQVPSLEIFADDFESGDVSSWPLVMQ